MAIVNNRFEKKNKFPITSQFKSERKNIKYNITLTKFTYKYNTNEKSIVAANVLEFE